ncbi:hypothetical protein M1K46_25365 [Fictibacillus sp. WQ 8-8]|uniref:hypothetical protein n=1 Tax=unclassified Fictibacillus TaxID=2644029 RepID=UPI00078073D3|nr:MULTISPECIES: hypothetical protein [unclassified Fictibacillus]MCQ6264054.1 hypothetical protein [Fictibacillus sp. WQ 8-8]MCQ6268883.1 hypothetical protein [Fictibacillus sp. WQ 8-8]MED2971194.1 hypothetical protein [Fictibacillus sp. B-59209]
MLSIEGEKVRGFLYDSLVTAKSDLGKNETIVTEDHVLFFIINNRDYNKVSNAGYVKVSN